MKYIQYKPLEIEKYENSEKFETKFKKMRTLDIR